MTDNTDNLDEVKVIKKVNSRGEKTLKKKCPKGFRLQGGACVPVTGAEKASKRKAIKKAVRTKKQAGSGLKRRTTKKRLKALKKRKAMGL